MSGTIIAIGAGIAVLGSFGAGIGIGIAGTFSNGLLSQVSADCYSTLFLTHCSATSTNWLS